ncbi:MAG: stage V sporulation protein T [Clostridia bacterium]|nr:stage V sporulation protein T [Clostridia bacterium]
MKATGVVRRIDDLGRIVVPKEIRKTLRIREGDPLEIFTDKEGEIILKKYSPIGELSEFASQYAETLAKTTGHIACISDKDTIIAVAGASKKEYLEKSVSTELEKLMEDRVSFAARNSEEKHVPVLLTDNDNEKYTSQVIWPIVAEGDTIGTVMLLSTQPNSKMNEVEVKVVQSAAGFLGKQMEE